MSKRKKLVIVLAIFAGLVLAGVVLLYALFPTDLIRDRAVAEMEAKLGRPVHVGGARLVVLPAVGADLTDVRVGERAEPGRPRLALASLGLRVRLLPLLRREVEITRVEIEKLDVEVVLAGAAGEGAPSKAGSARASASHGAQGTGTAATPAQGAPSGAGGPAGAGSGAQAGAERAKGTSGREFHFKVDRLIVNDGRVRVRSADGKPFVDLARISEDLKAEATSSGDLSLSGRTLIDSALVHLPAGDLGQGMRLRLDKVIRYDRSSDSLVVESAKLDLNGLPVSIRGTAASVSSGRPEVDVSLEGGPGEVSDILAYLPSAMFPEMKGVESRGTVALRASIDGALGGAGKAGKSPRGEPLDFNLDVTLTDGRIVHPTLPAPVEQVSLHAILTPQSVDVADFAAASGTNRVKARVKVVNYRSDPDVDAALDADLDLHEIAAMHPAAGDYKVGGRAAAQLSVRGPARNPDRLKVAGIVDLSGVGVQGPALKPPIEGATCRMLIQDDDLTLQKLSMKVGSSDLSAHGTVAGFRALKPGAPAGPPAKIDLVAHSGLLALDELIPASEGKGAEGGAGKPTGGEPDKPTGGEPVEPTGTESGRKSGTESGGQGGTPASPALGPAAALSALAGRIDFSADKVRTPETETGAARAILSLDRGLIQVERLDVNAFGGQVAVAGTVDYREPKAPDFDLKSQVQGARASDLLSSSKTLGRLSRLGGFLIGDVDASATLKGDLNEAGGLDLSSFTSIGDLSVHGGEIANQPLQVKLADFLEAPQLKTISLSDYYQPFRIEDGRLTVDGLSIKSKQIELSATGWQSIDGKVQMAFEVLLPRELSDGFRKRVPKELVPVLFDSAGSRVLVPLNVTGSYDSPQVSIDAERLTSEARAQAERRLAAERARLEEEAKRRGRGLLEGLVKSPSDTTAGAKGAEKAEKSIKKSLKDLFKRK
jgi:hypothetical protein